MSRMVVSGGGGRGESTMCSKAPGVGGGISGCIEIGGWCGVDWVGVGG